MRLRSRLLFSLLLLAHALAAHAQSQVRADATIFIFHSAACNELDIDSSYTATLLKLDPAEKGYPLGAWGELRACGFIGLLFQECTRSIMPKMAGESVTCRTYQHGAKCGKEYFSRADAFYGNQYYGVGASDLTNCDSEPCSIPAF
jgi:hypothetical protein